MAARDTFVARGAKGRFYLPTPHLLSRGGPRAEPNGNRTAGGTMRDGVVVLRLVIREVS